MTFLVTATRTGLVAATTFLVDSSPGPPLRFVLRNTAVLIAFFDMLSLALLLVGISGFVAARHQISPFPVSFFSSNCERPLRFPLAVLRTCYLLAGLGKRS
ncbi:hypothetical protein ASD00_19765 [Ensifer sp. Root31]|nr:hypothetical protein ASD00_19765 [Ensifer sp. Root31]